MELLEKPANGKNTLHKKFQLWFFNTWSATLKTTLWKSNKAVIASSSLYFNDAQRSSNKDAGKIAGLEVNVSTNQLQPLCLRFGQDWQRRKSWYLTWWWYTFDASILELGDGVFGRIVNCSGDNKLGWWWLLTKKSHHLVQQNSRKKRYWLNFTDKMATCLKDAAEKKKDLSGVTSTQISFCHLFPAGAGPLHLKWLWLVLASGRFDSWPVERTKSQFAASFQMQALSLSEIDEVILAGDSTRIPAAVVFVKAESR